MAEKRDIVVYEIAGADIDAGVPRWSGWPQHRGEWQNILDFKRGVSSSLAYFMRAWAHKNVSKDDADLVFEAHSRYSDSTFYKKSDPSRKYHVAPAHRKLNGAGLATADWIYLREDPALAQREAGTRYTIFVDKAGLWPELGDYITESARNIRRAVAEWAIRAPDMAASRAKIEEAMRSRRDEWKRLYPDMAENLRLEAVHNKISLFKALPWSPEKVAAEKKLADAGDPSSQYADYAKYAGARDIYIERAFEIEKKFPGASF